MHQFGASRVDLSLFVILACLSGSSPAKADVERNLLESPAELWIESHDPPIVGEPLSLTLIVSSKVSVPAHFEIDLNVPTGLSIGEFADLEGAISPGEERAIDLKLTPNELGDFRVRALLRFAVEGSPAPFVAENAAVIRVRVTRGYGDVFVDRKRWSKKSQVDQIKGAKLAFRRASQVELDQQIRRIQGQTPAGLEERHAPSAETIEQQAAYLRAARQSAWMNEARHTELKQTILGNGRGGHLGSRERYSHADGLILRDVPVSFIYRRELQLQGGQLYQFETANLSMGSDSVMLLFAHDEARQQWTEIASNDDADASTLASRIAFIPERDGAFVLLVRSYSPDARGFCDVLENGELLDRTRFGGAAFSITSDQGDVLHTVGMQRVPNFTDPLLIAHSGNGAIARWDDDGGMDLGAKMVLPEVSGAELLLGASSSSLEGKCDLVLNTADGTPGAHPRGDVDGDGLSNELERELGTRADLVDTDGDGLLDAWEVLGVRDTDYAGLGARGTVPDVFVQTDWMASTHDHKPRMDALQKVIDSFASTGINLHVDDGRPEEGGEGHLLPDPWTHLQNLTFLGETFNQIRAASFSAKRVGIYHYNIFAHQQAAGCSSGVATIRGSNFLVTLGCFSGMIGTTFDQSGTFMHELGHNLSLRHGGFEDLNYKPNYRSVMNYLFQLGGTCGTVRFTTGLTFSPCFPSRQFFYSFGDGFDLNETCLDESVGVVGDPIDWDGDGTIDTCVAVDINHPAGQLPDGRFDLLQDYPDYNNLALTISGAAKDTQPIEEEIVSCAPPPSTED